MLLLKEKMRGNPNSSGMALACTYLHQGTQAYGRLATLNQMYVIHTSARLEVTATATSAHLCRSSSR